MKAKKDRKSKGTFSVIGEFFSDSGLGDIVYDPKLPPEQAAWIEKATHLADVPLSRRAEAEKDYDTKKQFLAEDAFVGKSTKKSNF